jgi:hypothetical protein
MTTKTSIGSYGLPVLDPLTDACAVLRAQNIANVKSAPGWCILSTRFFYGPEERTALVRGWNSQGEPEVFPTRAAALAWIAETEAEIYRCSHNESGRPRYALCRPGSRAYKSGLDCWGL